MSKGKKILVFDGQVFQTPAWHRGMGKYSLELIASINALNKSNKYWSEVTVIMSSKFSTEDSVEESFKQRAPEVKVVKLELAHNEYDNRPVANRNRQVTDNFLNDKILIEEVASIDYVALSLMQSELAPTFSRLSEVHNYLLFYDLIPLMFYKTYLPDAINQKGYLSKLAELLQADTYLAISKTVANDLATVLGIDTKRIVSIDGAPIEHGHNSKPIDMPKPFILMPTGNDLRKNNRRGIEAFARFNKKHKNKFHLLVTSTFRDFEVEKYKKITNKVIFTGNISGEELEYLYEETSALLFPTEYEGLGLPILEALEKDKPVACSDISVFQEISPSAFFYFDPTDIDDIAKALNEAVGAKTLPKEEYKRVLKKFTWERTAKLFYEQATATIAKDEANRRSKLTIFSAATDESNFGAEVQQLYSELSRISEVNFCMDTQNDRNKDKINYLSQITETTSIGHFTRANVLKNSQPIYFIENDANCAAVLMIALANPGVLILADSQLEKLWEGAVDRNYIHQTRYEAEVLINETYTIKGMLATLLASQKVVIANSKDKKKQLVAMVKKLPIENRPEIVYAPRPTAKIVYPELSHSLALYDYPGETDTTGTGSYSEFSKTLVEVSRITGEGNE